MILITLEDQVLLVLLFIAVCVLAPVVGVVMEVCTYAGQVARRHCKRDTNDRPAE